MTFEYGFTKKEKDVLNTLIYGWFSPKFKKRRGYYLWDVEFIGQTPLNITEKDIADKLREKAKIIKLMKNYREREAPFDF